MNFHQNDFSRYILKIYAKGLATVSDFKRALGQYENYFFYNFPL